MALSTKDSVGELIQVGDLVYSEISSGVYLVEAIDPTDSCIRSEDRVHLRRILNRDRTLMKRPTREVTFAGQISKANRDRIVLWSEEVIQRHREAIDYLRSLVIP